MPPSPQGSTSSVSPSKLAPPKAKHPTNVPYDPLVHVNSKPPFSFSSLIFMAIENSQQKALPVKEIYSWIVQQFPYFKTAPTGWKNSVRHNLSLNKCFQKVEKAANLGKGSLWMVEPQFRPNLIQALSRSPFHAGSGMDKATYKSLQQQRSNNASPTGNGSHYSKDNFPQLTSRLAPADAQNGLMHHDDLDDISRSSTPIDYDGGGGGGGGELGVHHSNLHPYQHPSHLQQHEQQPHHHLSPSAVVQQQQHHQQLIAIAAAGGVGYHHHSRHGVGSPEPSVNGVGGANTTNTTTTYLSTVDGATIVSCPTGVVYMNGAGSAVNGASSATNTIEDVNAATAMLALKHGPKIFTESSFRNGNPPVITTSPSEDHTYSAGGVGVQELASNGVVVATTNGGGASSTAAVPSNGISCCSSSDERYEPNRHHQPQHHAVNHASNHHLHPVQSQPPHQQHHSIRHSDNISNGASSDATYESSEENHPPHAIATAEDVEERRRQEGVFALLNLSQMTYSHSPSSSISSSASTLSSPSASSTGSLKRAAPNDSPYGGASAGHNGSYHHRQQHDVASPDRTRAASPQHHHLPQHHLHHHTPHLLHQADQGGNMLQPIVSFYGGAGGGSSSSSSSADLTRQYASPPPAKKTKPRSSLKKLKKKSLAR
uniref:Fork-head domain-containing protein n=1 Tax=Anopheles farauti TaxID=69004 RepID=A0A182QB49_9DIPT